MVCELGRVVDARSSPQQAVEELDAKPEAVNQVLIGVDERDFLRQGCSDSVPRRDAARLSASMAQRSSQAAQSRSCTRCASVQLTPTVSPSSMSACSTHICPDSTP